MTVCSKHAFVEYLQTDVNSFGICPVCSATRFSPLTYKHSSRVPKKIKTRLCPIWVVLDDRQTDRQTDIHTYIHKFIYIHLYIYIHTPPDRPESLNPECLKSKLRIEVLIKEPCGDPWIRTSPGMLDLQHATFI